MVLIAVVLTAIGLVLKSLVETYEGFAELFGRFGRFTYAHGLIRRSGSTLALLQEELGRVLEYVERMETNLEMINAYLVTDAHWHSGVEVILAEAGMTLPGHTPFSEFSRKWRTGWRPPA